MCLYNTFCSLIVFAYNSAVRMVSVFCNRNNIYIAMRLPCPAFALLCVRCAVLCFALIYFASLLLLCFVFLCFALRCFALLREPSQAGFPGEPRPKYFRPSHWDYSRVRHFWESLIGEKTKTPKEIKECLAVPGHDSFTSF